jgi:hypothetical protein
MGQAFFPVCVLSWPFVYVPYQNITILKLVETGSISYLVKNMICAIELRRRDLMADIPALFTNKLISISGSYVSQASRRLHHIHLSVYVGTDLISELSADLMSLSGVLLGRPAAISHNGWSFRLINNHEGVLLRRRASHQHFMCK